MQTCLYITIIYNNHEQFNVLTHFYLPKKGVYVLKKFLFENSKFFARGALALLTEGETGRGRQVRSV